MTITDHILLVISFRQALYYNKALWSKNFTPSRLSRPWQLTMLKDIRGPISCHWRNFRHGLWLFGKLTFWKTASACIAVYSLTDSAFKPWTTTEDNTGGNIQHISVFSMSPGRGTEHKCYFVCMSVCSTHVVHVWHLGWDGCGNMELLQCSGACPWRCCHW